MAKNVLIIEDDTNLADLMEIHLKDMSYVVNKVANGAEGLEMARTDPFDLIVLDIMLPGMDGMQICTSLRQEKNTTPIIMVTAKSEDMDKLMGLECGADVYMTKPFNILEFKARVKALFRRIAIARNEINEEDTKSLQFDGLSIDLSKRSVYMNDVRIDLTPKEFDLLALLAAHPGRTYTREQLLNLIWGYEYYAYEHTVNSHINRLRAKIEPEMSNPKYIMTSWGVGYRFAEL